MNIRWDKEREEWEKECKEREKVRGRGIGKRRRIAWQWESSDENVVMRGDKCSNGRAARAAAMILQ